MVSIPHVSHNVRAENDLILIRLPRFCRVPRHNHVVTPMSRDWLSLAYVFKFHVLHR